MDKDDGSRLTPAMASRRLQVLSFVRRYIERWGGSPSYGEIAAGCEISRSRARQLVQALVRQGQLLKANGERGLAMPDDRAAAIRILREAGFQVDEDHCTITPLRRRVTIDYLAEDGEKETRED